MPKITIDERLFAHINTDPFLQGSTRLQGELFENTIGYLNEYISTLDEKEDFHHVKRLQTMWEELVKIEKEISNIRQLKDSAHAPVETQKLADVILDKIKQLPPGDGFLIPGGWVAKGGGHAIIYEWARDTDGNLLFKVHNSGAGLSFHEKRSSIDKELYNPVLTYKIPPSAPEDKGWHNNLKQIINQLIELQVPSIHKQEKISPPKLYVDVLYQLAYLKGEKYISTDVNPKHWYTGGQISGTCAQRSLHQMLKSSFPDLNSYRKFIYGLKSKSIDEYHKVLVDNKQTDDIKYMSHFEEAIRHNLRLLMLHEAESPDSFLFSREKRDADRTKLEGYLSEVRQARVKSASSQAPTEQLSFYFIDESSFQHRITIPTPIKPNTHEQQVMVSANISDAIPVPGGDNLLDDLGKVLERCRTLKKNRQTHELLEQLELLIHHLPMPSTINEDLLPYYSGIDSEQKSYDFYQKISEIEQLYFGCHDELIDKNHSTPNMYLAVMTLYTVIGHINHRYTLTNRSQSFHSLYASSILYSLIAAEDSPYIATQHPVLDERLNHIKELYKKSAQTYKETSLIHEYLNAILDTEPALKEKLNGLYSKKYSAQSYETFHKALIEKGVTALFYFFEHYEEADFNKEFKPLIDKFKTQKILEESYIQHASRLYDSYYEAEKKPIKFKITYNYTYGDLEFQTPFMDSSSTKYIAISQDLVRSKYVNKPNCFQDALAEDNEGTKKGEEKRENNCQLWPSTIDPRYNTPEKIQETASLPLTKQTLAERELFHLRANHDFQIDLTLAYFNEYIHKLKDINYQRYLEANLFQPGLLLNKLNSQNSAEFMAKFNAFIRYGQQVYETQAGHSKTSAALLYLKYQVYQYAYLLDPQKYGQHINTLLTELNQAIDLTRPRGIKHQLYSIQFQALMTKQLHQPLSPDEMKALIEARIVCNVIAKNVLDYDTDTTLKIEKQQFDFIRLVQHYPFDASIFKSILEKLQLPSPTETIIFDGQHPNYNIYNAANERIYTVDIEHGLVYKDGLACSALPLEIITHPAMSDIGIKNAQTGFVSADRKTYYLEQPPISVRCILGPQGYHIQKKFTDKEGNESYFELTAQSKEHKVKYQLADECDDLSFGALVKQRDILMWTQVDNPDEFIMTTRENNERLFEGTALTDAPSWNRGWLVTQCKTKDKLLDNASVEHPIIEQFESKNFICFYKKADYIEINLHRYNISLALSEKTKQVSYHWQGNEYTLTNTPTLIPGIQSLHFKHKNDNICVIPIQFLISTNQRQANSKYYQLHLDTGHNVADQQMKKVKNKLWQHTGTQKHLVLKVKDGIPVPETPAQALYLSYLYMGTNDYETAWKMIESCDKRLGGLEGTYEELQYLQWICKCMPFSLTSDVESAEVLNPNSVACKLKALSLLTTLKNQGKKITIPPPKEPENDINNQYENSKIKDVAVFNHQINDTIFQLYKNYQLLSRESIVDYRLSDDERYSLLHYYHQQIGAKNNTAPKAIGALGYDWVSLKLDILKKELAQLNAKTNPRPDDKRRIEEIKSFVEEHEGVLRQHADIQYVKIDTALPKECALDLNVLTLNERSAVKKPFPELKTTGFRDQAIDCLSPWMSESTFIMDFSKYLAIAVDRNSYEEKNRKRLKDFCHATLVARRHTPLAEQSGNITRLCNVLYRILNSDNRNQQIYSYETLFEYAATLPDPEIEIPQLVDDTKQVLKTAKQIFDTLPEHLPTESIKSLPNLAEHLNQIQLFNSDDADWFEKSAEEWRKIESIYMESGLTDAQQEKSDEFLSHDERAAGIMKYQAFRDFKKTAATLLDDTTIKQLDDKLKDRINFMSQENSKEEGIILELANHGPENEVEKLQWEHDITVQIKKRLDIPALVQLYFQNDLVQYRIATGLNDTQIQALHGLLTQYVKRSQCLQQLQRANKQIAQVNASVGDERDLRKIKLAQTLYAKNLIDPITEPALSVYQMYENILIRPIQKSAIERLLVQPDEEGFSENIERIIMGGGKSKVLLPTLAYKKAKGNNLVIISVPNALLRTNYVDLKNSSTKLFNQEAILFEFNRNSDCSAMQLETLFDRFTQAIVNKKYLVTTGDALQSLELKYLELLHTPPNNDNIKPLEKAEWEKQVYWADKLVNLFRQRGDLIIDEVHLGLLLKNKLNYTVGDSTKIDNKTIQDTIELFKFLKKCHVQNDENETITFDQIIYQNQIISNPSKYQTAFECLLTGLIEDGASPLRSITQNLSPDERTELHDYLSNAADQIPAWIQKLSPKEKNKLALYKEQVSHLLPHSFKKNHHEHFGPSHLSTHSPELSVLAIPYIANNTPNERSRFGNPLLTINFTIQSLLNNGISKPLFHSYLDMLLTQAKQETEGGKYAKINDTPSARQFSAILGDSKLSLSDVDLENDALINSIHERVKNSELLIYDVLEKKVLPNIRIDPQILHSDAYNYVDFVRSCQGMSGTPANYSTFHKRLNYHEKSSQGTDGLVYETLKEKTDYIWGYDYTNTQDAITQLFGRYDDSAQLRAIIDINATFKGQNNLTVASVVAGYLLNHPSKFQQSNPIKYILFFNEDNQICALPLSDFPDNPPIVIGSSDVAIINARLGCGPEERFTIYDQAHTTGTDIKQAENARALVMADDRTSLSSFFQGVMRMRGLIEESQRLDIVVPTKLSDKRIESICDAMYQYEHASLQEDNYAAACAQLKNSVRNHVMRMILAIEGDDKLQRKSLLFNAFASLFLEIQERDLFKKYGGLQTMETTAALLEKLKTELLSSIKKHATDSKIDINPEAFFTLEETMKNIIIDACKPGTCKEKQVTNQSDFDAAVEVQKETQVEVEVEKELHISQYDITLKSECYYQWKLSDTTDLEPTTGYYGMNQCQIKTLSEICKSAANVVPDFSPNIKATQNFFMTYEGQKNFLNMYLKPVHSLLFKYNKHNQLECFILSQKEGVELAKSPHILAKHKAWIANTQYECLAGKEPEGIRSMQDYQTMIEQIKFFNGEFHSLLTSEVPLNWLRVSWKEKLNFFEKYLYQNHETLAVDLSKMRAYFLNNSKVFDHIINHLTINGETYDWQLHFRGLEDNDILEIKQFCLACNQLHANWQQLDLSNNKWYANKTISLKSLGYLQEAIDKFKSLKEVIQAVQDHFDDTKGMVIIKEKYEKAARHYPVLQSNPTNNQKNRFDILHSILDLMNAEKFAPSDDLIKLLADDPDITSEQLQYITEIAKTDSKTHLKIIKNPSKLIDETILKSLITYGKTAEAIIALANHPRLTSTCYRDLYVQSQQRSCAGEIISSLLNKIDCPIELCLDFAKDEQSYISTEHLKIIVKKINSTKNDHNISQLLKIILERKHIPRDILLVSAASTNDANILNEILKRTDKSDLELLHLILNHDEEGELLNDFAQRELSVEIALRLIKEPRSSDNLITHCLTFLGIDEQSDIIKNADSPLKSIHAIAAHSEHSTVLNLLIRRLAEHPPLNDKLWMDLLSNQNLCSNELELMATVAPSQRILVAILESTESKNNESIIINAINNKNMTDMNLLLRLFKDRTEPKIINRIIEKIFQKDVSTDAKKELISLVNTPDNNTVQNQSDKLKAITSYIDKHPHTIKVTKNQSITSNRYIMFKTMKQEDKERDVKKGLADLNIAIASDDKEAIQRTFNQLCLLACTRRNALAARFSGEFSTNTKSAKYLIEKFETNNDLMNALNIKTPEELKEKMRAAYKSLAAEGNHAIKKS